MNVLGWTLQRRDSGLVLTKPPRQVVRQVVRGRRDFDAGKQHEMFSAWSRSPVHINQSLQKHLRAVRARARNEGLNNAYGDRFLNRAKSNIVGPNGIVLRARIKNKDGTPDRLAGKAIETGFREWSHEENCSMSGTLDLIAIQNAYLHATAEDGETIWMSYFGKQAGPWGFALHQIDAEQLDIDLNKDGRRGARIRMGIEIDSFARPLNYYFRAGKGDAYDEISPGGQKHRIVPASRIYHGFLRERPGQLRGVPWMASTLTRMRMLHGYQESAVAAARIGAAKVGFITHAPGDEQNNADEIDPVTGEMVMNAEMASWFNLEEGQKVESWNPDYPHAQFKDFVKSVLQGISAGLDMDYPSLSGDLEGVNFSSIRAGVLETRETWKGLQGWMSRGFMRWVYLNWLPVALAKEKLLVANQPLSISYEEKYRTATWQGRRWPWVDPLKDMSANKVSNDERWRSKAEIIADLTGRDPDDVWDEIEAEEADLKKRGIPANSGSLALQFTEDINGSEKTTGSSSAA